MEDKGILLVYRDLFVRLGRMFIWPKIEWSRIRNENSTQERFLTELLLPLLGVLAIAVFIVKGLETTPFSVSSGLKYAIAFFSTYFIVYYLLIQALPLFYAKKEEAIAELAVSLIGYPILMSVVTGFWFVLFADLLPLLALNILSGYLFSQFFYIERGVFGQKKIACLVTISLLLLTLPPAVYMLLVKLSSLK